MNPLWTQETEREFFTQALRSWAPSSLFYETADGKHFAYWPKTYDGKRSTLQSRNACIGEFTEQWSQSLLEPVAKRVGLFAVRGVICPEIELTKASPGDLAVCRTQGKWQKPEDILVLFEVKMSVIWNWEFRKQKEGGELICVGDYMTHAGTPGLLRSDSMLKAIGKAVNVRASGQSGSNIAVAVLGNTPIAKSYQEKVDNLRKLGLLQRFLSLNPNPIDDPDRNIKITEGGGFLRADSLSEAEDELTSLIKTPGEFFAGRKTGPELGSIIEEAAKEDSLEAKADKFLQLMRQ